MAYPGFCEWGAFQGDQRGLGRSASVFSDFEANSKHFESPFNGPSRSRIFGVFFAQFWSISMVRNILHIARERPVPAIRGYDQ